MSVAPASGDSGSVGGEQVGTPRGPKHILVLGSGFAGLWAAIGAARRISELGLTAAEVTVTVVGRTGFHDIRVRNYEADLSQCRIPLGRLLDPVGVDHLVGEVESIDTAAQSVTISRADRRTRLHYDRLVIALGSAVIAPPIPGLAEYAFNIDTYDAAIRLNEHLAETAGRPIVAGSATVVVIGAGLTGIEAATELPAKLATAWAGVPDAPPARVLLLDHNPRVGSDMGDSARPAIAAALAELGVQTVLGARVIAIDANGISLDSAEVIAASTVIWCAGMRANPLTAEIPGERDQLGRLTVDEYLRVTGTDRVFAAGDTAAAAMDEQHRSVMSCQHARPMGRFAGYNVVGDLCGKPMLSLQIPWYVTVLDLGPAGAVYTEGWDRTIVATGKTAKITKRTINTRRIYPPLDGVRADILAAAAPVVQAPPKYGQISSPAD